MVYTVSPPYQQFTDTDGSPLENGYIWIGNVNQDPQASPASVYWDKALTIPAAQPIRTLNGYPVNNGTPTNFYAASDYSIRVMNKSGSTIYNAPKSGSTSQFVSVKDFGAVGDGVTDDSAAIQAAFNASNDILFPDGSYLINVGITKAADNVRVDFGNATVINNGAAFTFTFGTTSNTPLFAGLKVTGGQFIQAVPATASNLNYIRLAGYSDFNISKVNAKNVSNGGIYIEAGCEDGVIDSVVIEGMSGYSTNRGIWINGATASDYASQLVDISSITRNATALPTYAVKNIRVVNSTVKLPYYGVYCMNSRDVIIENCHIDVSGGGGRCIALNNYSPGAIVRGCTLKGDQASTGILITQFSHDVVIDGNIFLGTFGGGRDVYVAYLADCMIINNRFNTNSSQNILIDMGATAIIDGNYFNRTGGVTASGRCVLFTTIDEAVAGTSTYGDTATTLSGIVFANNVVKNRLSAVNVRAKVSASGNIPGLDVVTVRDNVLYNYDLATTADEYGLAITAPGTTYKIAYSYFGNTVYPSVNAARNWVNVISGSGVTDTRTDAQIALFRCVSPAGSGAITSTKTFGGFFSCTGTNNGGAADTVTISPRTLAGAVGAAVARPVCIIDVNGTFSSYEMTASGVNYVIKFYNSSGVLIDLGTVSVTFDVLVTWFAT